MAGGGPRVVASGTECVWEPVPGGAFQQPVLDPALPGISMNGLDDGAEWALRGLASDTEWDE